MNYVTTNPLRDAEQWEAHQEAIAEKAEHQQTAAFETIKNAFIEGLQWGPNFNIALPKGMAPRNTSEAIYELADSGHGQLIDKAVFLLANLNDPVAKTLVQEMAHTYAQISMKEWQRTSTHH